MDYVVMGGGISKSGEFIRGPTCESMSQRALNRPGKTIVIIPLTWRDDASVVGAHRLATMEKEV